MKKDILFQDMISLENLLEAWKEFVVDKRSRKDVQEFEQRLMSNIILLHNELTTDTYRHSAYEAFNISDPKPRNIHKAKVRDRLLHHAIYRKLYPFFDRKFVTHSYSCRLGKGTHKALESFRTFLYKISKNNTRTVWILKCDIRKFFASIDHEVLLGILKDYVIDKNSIYLLEKVIKSFCSVRQGVGLPLGNLTSQLLVNIYMNEFDQFVKHRIQAKYYIRYADDFIILSEDKRWLESILPRIDDFLLNRLKLCLHPGKVFITTLSSGVDFLGWIHFKDHTILRTITKKRMIRNSKLKKDKMETIQSYLGLLHHGNTERLKSHILYIVNKSEKEKNLL